MRVYLSMALERHELGVENVKRKHTVKRKNNRMMPPQMVGFAPILSHTARFVMHVDLIFSMLGLCLDPRLPAYTRPSVCDRNRMEGFSRPLVIRVKLWQCFSALFLYGILLLINRIIE